MRQRTLVSQIHWRATLADLKVIDAILTKTQETQSDMLRRVIREEARRLALAEPKADAQ